MTIDITLVPPSRTDTWDVFSDKADQILVDLVTWASQANALAAEMNQDLTTALSASVAGVTGTSATSLTVGSGTRSLTVSTSMDFVPGMEVVIAYTTTPTTRMVGTVVSYNSVTGALDVDVTSYTGSGTFTDWTVSLTVAVSFDGRTYTDLRLSGKFTEQVYTITDGASVNIDPSNGTIQVWTLTASRTPTSSLDSGQAVTLLIDDGSAYAVSWATIGVIWVGGTAPTLSATGYTIVQLFKVGTATYGTFLGYVA